MTPTYIMHLISFKTKMIMLENKLKKIQLNSFKNLNKITNFYQVPKKS